jgi:hypothetical protein
MIRESDISMASDTKPACSGRFLLRIDPGLHAALREAAGATGVSLNEYCARKLVMPCSEVAGLELATEAVRRAAEVVGGNLIGVVVFGSWARGNVHDQSDIDLLVVVDDTVALSRDLYLAWDTAPVEWHGRRAEPHFVHLPEPARKLTGLWAEVAIDGIMLFTRGLKLPVLLAEVRRDIAGGRIVRRVVHGQPYWTEVA